MFLSRDDILGCDDLKRERVDIPQWGGAVYVRVMTGAEKDWWEAASFDDAGDQIPVKHRLANMRARMAVVTVCDEHGASLFALADVELLTRKCAPALDRIWQVAARLNLISQAEEDALKNVSGVGQNDASGSGSP